MAKATIAERLAKLEEKYLHELLPEEERLELRERREEVIRALRPETVQTEAEVFDLARAYFGVEGPEDVPGFVARGLDEASGLGLVARWSRTLGYVSIHDPTTGEWIEVQAKDAPAWARWESRKRKELRREGVTRMLTATEMEEVWEEETVATEDDAAISDRGLVYEDDLASEGIWPPCHSYATLGAHARVQIVSAAPRCRKKGEGYGRNKQQPGESREGVP